MKLALFDLDHTLLPFDSGMAWLRLLVGEGALPGQAEADYLAVCRRYVAGTLDVHAVHRACVAPLRGFAPAQLAAWLAAFERRLAPRVPAASLALVRQHQQAGHCCVLVTATTRLLAEPCARLFGIEQVLATEAARDGGGLTGEILGPPCVREHKLDRVQQWLAACTPSFAGLAALDASWFYSDAASDLPLLAAVSNPVAANPDARLRAHALAAGWPVLELA